MVCTVRQMRPNGYHLLRDFLLDAIFKKDDMLLNEFILESPMLRMYYEDFGEKQHDYFPNDDIDGSADGAICIK